MPRKQDFPGPGPLPRGVFSVAEALDDLLDWPARLADRLALELRIQKEAVVVVVVVSILLLV